MKEEETAVVCTAVGVTCVFILVSIQLPCVTSINLTYSSKYGGLEDRHLFNGHTIGLMG
jgi:hypothetical protein